MKGRYIENKDIRIEGWDLETIEFMWIFPNCGVIVATDIGYDYAIGVSAMDNV